MRARAVVQDHVSIPFNSIGGEDFGLRYSDEGRHVAQGSLGS